jgi:hypothetical protein
MTDNPLDQLNVQLPGRLLAVEVVLVLLLRQKANVGRLLAEADEILTMLESNEMAQTGSQTARYALEVYQAARANLDHLGAQARGLRR